jgi:hypothetical protein
MPIPHPDPVELSPVESKVYSELWLHNIMIQARDSASGFIQIEALPYNSEINEIGPSEHRVIISTPDLWEAVAEIPEVRVAMGAIFQAVEPLRVWIENRAQNR